jgi:hypothetical protein
VSAGQIASLLYIVGSLLVFGSWMDLVPNGLGWIGWLMALAGWATCGARPKQDISNAEQIERLDQLRSPNVITDEEFLREKQRLLGTQS